MLLRLAFHHNTLLARSVGCEPTNWHPKVTLAYSTLSASHSLHGTRYSRSSGPDMVRRFYLTLIPGPQQCATVNARLASMAHWSSLLL